jgi:hypothetical protein
MFILYIIYYASKAMQRGARPNAQDLLLSPDAGGVSRTGHSEGGGRGHRVADENFDSKRATFAVTSRFLGFATN